MSFGPEGMSQPVSDGGWGWLGHVSQPRRCHFKKLLIQGPEGALGDCSHTCKWVTIRTKCSAISLTHRFLEGSKQGLSVWLTDKQP